MKESSLAQHVLQAVNKSARNSEKQNDLPRLAWMPSPWVVALGVLVLATIAIVAAWPNPSTLSKSGERSHSELEKHNNSISSKRESERVRNVTKPDGTTHRAEEKGDDANTLIIDQRTNDSSNLGNAKGKAQKLVIHVVGAVKQPGVFTLPEGSRVVAAVAAAGGTTAKADLMRINLARQLVDGEQLRVLHKGESETTGTSATTGRGQGNDREQGSKVAFEKNNGTADTLARLNRGDVQQLQQIPGIGPVLAKRILNDRTKFGPYRDISEIMRVSGIGRSLVQKLSQ